MALVFPLVLLWVAGAAVAFLDGRRRGAALLTFAALLLATGSAAWLLRRTMVAGPWHIVTGNWPAGIGIQLRADALGALFALLSLASITLAFAFEWMQGIVSRTFPALLLLLAAGLTGLMLTADAFNFYVFFEVSMMASFALTAYGQEPKEVRAAVVFTVVNLVGSAFFLAAIAALYRLTGTLDIPGIAARLSETEQSGMLTATLLFVALGLKLGLFPLHFWLPAVYRGTRPAVAAVLSGAVASIGSYGLLRFGLEIFPAAVAAARPILLGIGTASVLYGAVLAASRRVSAEVLAYSAIGQAGYVLVALAVGGPIGVSAAVLFAAVNAVNKTTLFLAIGVTGPFSGAAFAIGAFSVAGVPPTLGFAGKLELFRLGVSEGSAWLTALVLVGGALSFVYMFQAYQHTYWAAPRLQRAGSPRSARIGIAALAGLVILAGLCIEPLIAASRAAASTILSTR